MQTIEMTVSAQTQRRRRKRRSKFPRLFLTALAAFAAARLVLWAIDISAARAGLPGGEITVPIWAVILVYFGYRLRAWVEEAERRNLPNIPGTIEALAALETPKAKALFEKYKVVSPVELHARHEIQTEIFHKEINIEAETALLMVETLYIPAVTEQLTQLTTAIAQMKASGIKAGMKATTDRANQIGTLLDILPGQVRELRRAVDEADTRAIQTGMDNLRSTIDMLESLTDADLWPVPTYAELLFL